jgi:hypothetical protein
MHNRCLSSQSVNRREGMLDLVVVGMRLMVLVGVALYLPWQRTVLLTLGYALTKWLVFRFAFGLRAMDQMSAAYAFPSPGNSSFIMGTIIVDRFSLAETVALFQKMSSFPKAEHMCMRMVEVLGTMYWLPEDDFAAHKHVHVYRGPAVHTIPEVMQLLVQQMHIPHKSWQSPWEVYFIEDYQPDRTALFLKFHHSIGDGIGLQYYISACSEEPPHIMQRFAQRSLCRDIGIYAGFPVLLPYAGLKLMCVSNDDSALASRNRSLAGIKSLGLSPMFEVKTLKTTARRLGVSINEFVLTIILDALKKHLHEHYGDSREAISMGIPFNLKEGPSPGHEVKMNNDFAMFFSQFPLVTLEAADPRPAFRQVQAKLRELRTTILPYTYKLLQLVNDCLPATIGRFLITATSNRCPIIFTNVAGSRTPLIFGGKTVHDLLYLAPSIGTMAINICISSYAEKLNVISNADIHRLARADLLVQAISNSILAFVAANPGPSPTSHSVSEAD